MLDTYSNPSYAPHLLHSSIVHNHFCQVLNEELGDLAPLLGWGRLKGQAHHTLQRENGIRVGWEAGDAETGSMMRYGMKPRIQMQT